MNPTYKLETKELLFNSADFKNLTRPAFFAMTAREADKWFRSLPTNVEYLAPQDLKPLGVYCQIYTINGAPSVREVRTYDAKTDQVSVRLDTTLVIPVNEAGEELVTPLDHSSLEASDSVVVEPVEGAQ